MKIIIVLLLLFASYGLLKADSYAVPYQKLKITMPMQTTIGIVTNDDNNSFTVIDNENTQKKMTSKEMGFNMEEDFFISTDPGDSFCISLDYSIGQQNMIDSEPYGKNTFGFGIGTKINYFQADLYQALALSPFLETSLGWLGLSFGAFIPIHTFKSKGIKYFKEEGDSYTPVMESRETERFGWHIGVSLAERLKAFELPNLELFIAIDLYEIRIKDEEQYIDIGGLFFGTSYYFNTFKNKPQKGLTL